MNYLIKKLFNNVLLRNFVSLSSIQFFSYAINLVAYPYIIKTITIANFGKVSFALVIMSYLAMFVNFGYNYIGPKKVAVSKDNKDQLSRIVSNILAFRLAVFIVVSLLFGVYTYLFNYEEIRLYLCALVYLLGLTLLPKWYFQGIERMEFITIIDCTAKTLFVVLIFCFVKEPNDYWLVILLLGIGGIVSGFVSFYIIYFVTQLRLIKISWRSIIEEVNEGFPIFISNLSTFSFTNSNILILKYLTDDSIVGIYSVADKIAKIPWAIGGTFSVVIYPKVCRLVTSGEDNREILKFLKTIMIKALFVTLTVVFLAAFNLDFIVSIFSDEYIVRIKYILLVLLFSTVLIILNIPFNQLLLASNLNNHIMKIFVLTAGINVILAFPLIFYFEEFGAAIAHFITVLLLLVFLVITVKRSVLSSVGKIIV